MTDEVLKRYENKKVKILFREGITHEITGTLMKVISKVPPEEDIARGISDLAKINGSAPKYVLLVDKKRNPPLRFTRIYFNVDAVTSIMIDNPQQDEQTPSFYRLPQVEEPHQENAAETILNDLFNHMATFPFIREPERQFFKGVLMGMAIVYGVEIKSIPKEQEQ